MIPLDVVSATELGAYRLCRRRWLYDREQKIPAKTIPTALWIGSSGHRALERYHGNNRTVDDLMDGLRQGVDEQIVDLVDVQGFNRDAVLADVNANYGPLVDLLVLYEQYDKATTLSPWKVLETERRYHITLAPDLPVLTGQLDMLAEVDGDLVVIDNKFYGRSPDKRAFHLDTQMTAYSYLVWKVYGRLPAKCILNVLIKKKPSVTVRAPKLGTPPWQGRFVRLETERSQEAVESFACRTAMQMREMMLTAKETERAFPNPGWQCPSCTYYAGCLGDLSGATGDSGPMPWEESE